MSFARRILCAAPALSLLFLSGCSGEATKPRSLVPARIQISLSSTDIEYGQTAVATARVLDARGDEIADATVTWSSSDLDVFTVDPSGKVLASGAGAGTLRASAGSVADELALSVAPRILSLSAPEDEVAMYETLVISLPTGVTAASGEPIAGVLGGDTLWFYPSPEGLEAFAIGGGPASGQLRLEIDRNHIGFVEVTITPAPVVENPEVLIGKVVARLESDVEEMNTLEASAGEPIQGKDFVEAIGAQFTAWADTASAGSKMEMAQFLVANPGLLGSESSTGLSLSRSAAGSSQADSEGCIAGLGSTAEMKMLLCKGTLMLGVGAAGIGGKAAERLCANPASLKWCVGSLATIAGGLMLTRHSALKVIELDGVILNRTFSTFIQQVLASGSGASAPSSSISTFARSRSTTPAPLALTADERYEIGTQATYRSVIASDQGSDLPGLIVSAVATFDGYWQTLTGVVESLPTWVRMALPSLPAPVGATPAAPRVSASRGVPMEYLTAENPSSGTTVSFDPGIGALRVGLTEGLDRAFSFDLAYASPVADFKQQVTGTVRVDAEMTIVSGDGQNGEEGEVLAQPLVVQVINSETGAGVVGAPVQWTITSGDGSISSPTSLTGSDGRANINWTLGTDSTHSLSAQVSYSDGAVAGGPVVFDATVGDSVAIYEAMVPGQWSINWYTNSDGKWAQEDIIQLNAGGTGAGISSRSPSWSQPNEYTYSWAVTKVSTSEGPRYQLRIEVVGLNNVAFYGYLTYPITQLTSQPGTGYYTTVVTKL